MSGWEFVGVLVGGYLVLAIYSFLWKENAVYRVIEHLYIGVSMGYWIILTWKNFLYPDWFVPLMGWDLKPWESYSVARLLWLPPAIFGMGIYCILSKKYNWIARCVIGFGLGYAGGLAFQGFFAEFLPLLIDSFKPLIVLSPTGSGTEFSLLHTFENWLFVISLCRKST